MSNKKTRSINKNAPPLTCFYRQHGYEKPHTSNNSTTFRCGECKVPLSRPSKGNCWQLPILNGVPKKGIQAKLKINEKKKGQCFLSL